MVEGWGSTRVFDSKLEDLYCHVFFGFVVMLEDVLVVAGGEPLPPQRPLPISVFDKTPHTNGKMMNLPVASLCVVGFVFLLTPVLSFRVKSSHH